MEEVQQLYAERVTNHFVCNQIYASNFCYQKLSRKTGLASWGTLIYYT